MEPDVVHCHDLDTLYAGWRIKKRLGCPLIYDAHEHYPAMMSLSFPPALVRGFALWERRLIRRVDATITASTVLGDEFASRGVSPVITLGNYHDLEPYRAVTAAEVRDLRTRLGVAPDDVLVAYVGGFSPNRMLLPMIEAAGLLPAVKFHIWGDGVQRAAIEQAAAARSNVSYHGWLAAKDLPRHFKAADVIFYGLKLDYPGAVYNAPNTLSCAMAAGRPVVATDVGDLGRIVRAADCGVLLGEVTPRAIAAAIEQLLDPATRARLGGNGLRAAEGPYNAAAQRASCSSSTTGWACARIAVLASIGACAPEIERDGAPWHETSKKTPLAHWSEIAGRGAGWTTDTGTDARASVDLVCCQARARNGRAARSGSTRTAGCGTGSYRYSGRRSSAAAARPAGARRRIRATAPQSVEHPRQAGGPGARVR